MDNGYLSAPLRTQAPRSLGRFELATRLLDAGSGRRAVSASGRLSPPRFFFLSFVQRPCIYRAHESQASPDQLGIIGEKVTRASGTRQCNLLFDVMRRALPFVLMILDKTFISIIIFLFVEFSSSNDHILLQFALKHSDARQWLHTHTHTYEML